MKLPSFSLSRFGAVNVVKKQAYPVSSITAYEFEFYTEDWSGGSLVDGEFRPVRANHYALTRPGQRQQLVAPYQCYFINFLTADPELCEFFDRLPAYGPVWDMESVLILIREMMALRDEGGLDARLKLESCACRLLAAMSEYGVGPEYSMAGPHRRQLLAVDRYMREHPGEDLSLARLARMSSMDPTYFHKLFTRTFGVTPARRVLMWRIAAARMALTDRDLSLAEIAQMCGFASQSYFSTCFRQEVGKTPRTYRAEKLDESAK